MTIEHCACGNPKTPSHEADSIRDQLALMRRRRASLPTNERIAADQEAEALQDRLTTLSFTPIP